MSAQPVNLFNYMHLAQLRCSLAQTMVIHRGNGLHRDNALWYPKKRHQGLQRRRTERLRNHPLLAFPEMGELNFRAQCRSAPRRIPAFGCNSANDEPAHLLIRT